MYDAHLFQQTMLERGLNFYRLGRKAHVDPKTAKSIITTGSGNPDSVYKVAKALGFDVRKKGAEYDFSSIVKRIA